MKQTSIFTVLFSLASITFNNIKQIQCNSMKLPDKWWLNTHAKSIYSLEELNAEIAGPSANKHIFIDFYMQQCQWCYYIQDDFNRLESDVNSWFGENKVSFFKIDGNLVPSISRKYNVPYYPYLIYIAPGSNGERGNVFNSNPRNYEQFKKWVLNNLKDETPVQGVSIPGFREEEQIKHIHEQAKQVVNNANYQQQLSSEQYEALLNILKVVGETSISSAKKLEELITIVQTPVMNEAIDLTQPPAIPDQGTSQPPLVYFLGGIIAGSIGAVILTIYMNKQLPRGKIHKRKGMASPGSPRALNLDEEKTA